MNFRLKLAMHQGVVKFYYQKGSGEVREAYGTLRNDLLPETKGTDRKPNPTVQTLTMIYELSYDSYLLGVFPTKGEASHRAAYLPKGRLQSDNGHRMGISSTTTSQPIEFMK